MNLGFLKRKPSNSDRGKSTKPKNSQQASMQRQYHGAHPNAANNTEQSLLSSVEAQKLRRLRKDGIVILVDQPNLEYSMEERENKRLKDAGKVPCWSLSYGWLKYIIARRGIKSHPPRRVLGTYIVTSKKFQSRRKHRPSSNYLERHNITLVRSLDERKKYEKAVDTTLVRIMTQEFEGIEIQRLNGKTPPKRTFCLVAGDFDYVDVVQRAREVGCDVEIWFWTRDKDMGLSQEWHDQFLNCHPEKCACLALKDLEPYLKELSRNWKDNSDAWSQISDTD